MTKLKLLILQLLSDFADLWNDCVLVLCLAHFFCDIIYWTVTSTENKTSKQNQQQQRKI